MNGDSKFKSILTLTRHSLIYGVGHVLSRSIGFLLLPVYTNFILPEKLGIAALLFLFLAFMTIIYQIGFSEAFLRYFALTTDLQKRRLVFSNSYISVIIISLFFSLIIFQFSDHISLFIFHTRQYKHLILLCIGILLGDVLAQIPLLTLRVEEKSYLYLALTLSNIVINLAMNIIFIVVLGKGVTGIFISNAISSLFLLVLVFPVILKYFRFTFRLSVVRMLFLFGFPYVFSGTSKIIMDLADRFLLERLIGLKTVGIYNASYKLGTIMGLIVAGFRFAWNPYSLSISQRADAKTIYARVLTYFILVAGFVFLVVSFFLEYILKIKICGISFFGAQYLEGIIIVPHIMLSYILYGIYSILIVGIFIEKKSFILPIITGVGAVTNIVGNLFMIPYLGMTGAAITTVISYLIMVIFLYFYIQKYYFVSYEFERLIKLILIFSIVFFMGYSYHGANHTLIRLTLLILTPVLLYFSHFFDRVEIARIKTFLKDKSLE